AFEILERARGRAAADIIRSQSLRPPIPDEKTRALEREIGHIQARLQFENLGRKSERQALLDQLWLAKEKLNSIPEPRTPYQEQTIHSSPVTVEELRSVLRPDEVLLEYVLSDPASYCIVITERDLEIVSLAGRKKVEARIEGYLSDIRAGKPGGDKASQLYSILLRPVLKNQKKSKRLTLVPDGKLHLLPFEALLDS